MTSGEIGRCACLDGFGSAADSGPYLGASGERGDCGFRHTGTRNEKWENSEFIYEYLFEVTTEGTASKSEAAAGA